MEWDAVDGADGVGEWDGMRKVQLWAFNKICATGFPTPNTQPFNNKPLRDRWLAKAQHMDNVRWVGVVEQGGGWMGCCGRGRWTGLGWVTCGKVGPFVEVWLTSYLTLA